MMDKTTRILACMERHPNWNAREIAKSLALRVADVEAARGVTVSAPAPVPGGVKKILTPAAPAGVISLASIRDRLDVAAAIKREIGRMGRGSLVPEDEICRITAGKDRNRFRRAVDNNPDLAQRHRVKLKLDDGGDGRWFWGRAEDVAEAVRIRDL